MDIHEKEKMLIQRSENQTFINEIKSRINQNFNLELVSSENESDHEKNIKIILFFFGIAIVFGCKKIKLF
tara:strand:- start:219 stop:428 length:210 start_codon:yes stop_codon:yes gene_type:complete